jgi:hypothetical protein
MAEFAVFSAQSGDDDFMGMSIFWGIRWEIDRRTPDCLWRSPKYLNKIETWDR